MQFLVKVILWSWWIDILLPPLAPTDNPLTMSLCGDLEALSSVAKENRANKLYRTNNRWLGCVWDQSDNPENWWYISALKK